MQSWTIPNINDIDPSSQNEGDQTDYARHGPFKDIEHMIAD